MTKPQTPSRRRFLAQSLGLGCSLAASPLITPVTLASAPGEARLVVIILRGALDGLDAIRPYGAPEFAALRGALAGDAPGAHDLDGFFSLHPALAPLLPLYARGEMGAVHAVSTPYRDKRSHFDGQDILEAGAGGTGPGAFREGWLNRLLQEMPDAHAETAYAVGNGGMLLTRGPAQVAEWSPEAALALSPQAERLLELVMHDDPLFRDAALEAVMLSQDSLKAMTGDAPLDAGGMMDAMQDSMRRARSGANPTRSPASSANACAATAGSRPIRWAASTPTARKPAASPARWACWPAISKPCAPSWVKPGRKRRWSRSRSSAAPCA
jgi:uncharacterized protein (DUF1501 family)